MILTLLNFTFPIRNALPEVGMEKLSWWNTHTQYTLPDPEDALQQQMVCLKGITMFGESGTIAVLLRPNEYGMKVGFIQRMCSLLSTKLLNVTKLCFAATRPDRAG